MQYNTTLKVYKTDLKKDMKDMIVMSLSFVKSWHKLYADKVV